MCRSGGFEGVFLGLMWVVKARWMWWVCTGLISLDDYLSIKKFGLSDLSHWS